MKVYIVYTKYNKDIKRKNSSTFSARKDDVRLCKTFVRKELAEREAELLNKCYFKQGCTAKIKEVEIN